MEKEIKNENAEAVVEAVSKTEKFFNENGKLLFANVVSVIKNVAYFVSVYGNDLIACFEFGFLCRGKTFNFRYANHKITLK